MNREGIGDDEEKKEGAQNEPVISHDLLSGWK
jgi:hypothetical protein